MFIRNIAIERDRAEAANNDRILEHAELLLHSDPTAAVAVLSTYNGSDDVRRRRLLAEAHGRGVARAVYTPHSDTIWFLLGDGAGAIVSVGEDRRIQLTQGTRSTTLARDVSTSVRLTYAPSRRLLAYATSPAGIALLDLGTRTTRRISTFDPAVMEFAPDGSLLAALDGPGRLVVWSTAPAAAPMYRAVLPGATSLRFATPTRLIVQDGDGIRAVALDAVGSSPDTRAIPDVTALDARPDAIVVGMRDGSVAMLSSNLEILGRTSVCRKRIRIVRFVPHTDRLAFSCLDSAAGVARYDAARSSFTIIDTFEIHGRTDVTPDTTGRYVAVADESGTAYIYDTETRLLTHYDGNAGQPSYVAPPTSDYDHVLIGDVNGTVRTWDAPTRAARVVFQDPDSIFDFAFMPDGKSIVTGGADRTVRWINLRDESTTELRGHTSIVLAVHAAPDASSVLSYGYDGTIRVWRAKDSTLSRRFADHASVIEGAEYIEHGQRIVSVGDDGRLLVWSPDGRDMLPLFSHESPLTGVVTLARGNHLVNDHVVVKDSEGSVWDISLDHKTRKVRDADGATVTVLRASADGNYVATGTDTGIVTVYDTSSWRIVKTATAEGSIRRIMFDPMDRDLLVASEAGYTQFGHVEIIALGVRTLPWHTFAAAVRDVAYAPDGETMGFVCTDGGTWLYSTRGDTWAYTRDHNADTLTGRFSPDGQLFASSDRQGVVIIRAVKTTLSAAAN